MSSNRLSSHLERSAVNNIHKQYYVYQSSNDRFKSKGVQTDYRENECQTDPWEPPYTVKEGHHPEVLELAEYMSEVQLPLDMHQMDVINRIRMKKAWEELFPPMDSMSNIKTRALLISALEADKWAFREAEIQFIMKLRMDLAEMIENSQENERARKNEARLKSLDDRLRERKYKEMKSIRCNLTKELRQITMKRESAKAKYNYKSKPRQMNSWSKSEYREPKARYECKSSLRQKSSSFPLQEQELEKVKKEFANWLSRPDYRADDDRPAKQICPRVRRRNEWKLMKLRQKFAGDAETPAANPFMRRKQKVSSLPPTPCLSPLAASGDAGSDEEQLLREQRATQCVYLDARSRYRELIEELRETESPELYSERSRVDDTSAGNSSGGEETNEGENRLLEVLSSFEGKAIAKMLTLLTDELVKLQNEKKDHAKALIEERERMRQEVERLSREKDELNRRRELDIIFRQIFKINQESVDDFLEEIVEESIEAAAAKQAEAGAIAFAEQVDIKAKCFDRDPDNDEEALVADMVYNFILPEVKKQSARKLMVEEQRNYLRCAHEAVSDEISKLPLSDTLLDEAPCGCMKAPTADTVSSKDSETQCGDLETIYNEDDSIQQIVEEILSYVDFTDDGSRIETSEIIGKVLLAASHTRRKF